MNPTTKPKVTIPTTMVDTTIGGATTTYSVSHMDQSTRLTKAEECNTPY